MIKIYVYVTGTTYRTCQGGVMGYTVDAQNNLFILKDGVIIRFFASGAWKEVVCQ